MSITPALKFVEEAIAPRFMDSDGKLRFEASTTRSKLMSRKETQQRISVSRNRDYFYFVGACCGLNGSGMISVGAGRGLINGRS
jgi:hypothetical protein